MLTTRGANRRSARPEDSWYAHHREALALRLKALAAVAITTAATILICTTAQPSKARPEQSGAQPPTPGTAQRSTDTLRVDPDILFELAGWARRLREIRRTCDAHDEASVRGDREAHVKIGDCFQTGRGRRRSALKALAHFQIAARLGSAVAHVRAGLIFRDGLVARNAEAAAHHFSEAARLGNPFGQIEYGHMLLDHGRPRAACAQFRQAHRSQLQGVVGGHVQRLLADCYALGHIAQVGPSLSKARALILYFSAAGQGDAVAQQYLRGQAFEDRASSTIRRDGCPRIKAAARRGLPAAMRLYTRCLPGN